MLMIRLQRVGRKGIPSFRLVLTDRRNSTKSGKFLERLGTYDPRKGGVRQFENTRIKELIQKGAKPSDTIYNLLIDEGVIEGKKINVLPRKSPTTKRKDVGKKSESPVLTKTESAAPAAGAAPAAPASEAVKEAPKVEIPAATSAGEAGKPAA